MEGITQTIYVKHIFTSEEILDLAQKMARAEAVINEKADALKSVMATIKAEIAAEEGISHSCAERIRSGYEMRPREAKVQYESGVVKYVDRDTGEILEERPMTPEEQLHLSNVKVTDAEDIIREARKEEMESL